MYIHEHFFIQAQQQPEHIAIVLSQEHLTYGKLAEEIERIARKLLCLSVQPARIALHLTKSSRALAMMFACLRSGIAYIPIDPKSPVERRNRILEDCQANVLVLDDYTAKDWKEHPFITDALGAVICPHRTPALHIKQLTWDEMLSPDDADPEPITTPASITENTLAYILYTSGSTGVPKGVMITHGNARAFVEWGLAEFTITTNDHIAVHAALHFDLPVFDIYVGLAKGATLYLVAENTALFPEALYCFLRDMAITVLYAVPSALTALMLRSSLRSNTLKHMRYLLYAGEEFHPAHLRLLIEQIPYARIFNLYGPIETNVVTQFEVKREHLDATRIPIGFPISTTNLFLLGADQQEVVLEGEGEIVISGPSVTPGYLNLPEQTEATRCSIQSGGRLWNCYCTGDFARRDSNGLLHFLGRRDGLIKTRGFRVELGEVEAILSEHAAVAEAVVVPIPHPGYTNLLYAFIVLHQGHQMSEAELQQTLHERLPSYMCPQRVFIRTGLPKTSTGKVARQTLQDELRAALQNG